MKLFMLIRFHFEDRARRRYREMRFLRKSIKKGRFVISTGEQPPRRYLFRFCNLSAILLLQNFRIVPPESKNWILGTCRLFAFWCSIHNAFWRIWIEESLYIYWAAGEVMVLTFQNMACLLLLLLVSSSYFLVFFFYLSWILPIVRN